MAKRSYTNLQSRASKIKTETLADANTADRIGSEFMDMLDSAVLEYDPGRAYKTDELAYRQGITYQAISDVPTGSAPPNDRYWTAFGATPEEVLDGIVKKPVFSHVLYQLLSTLTTGNAVGYADTDKAGIAMLLKESEVFEADSSKWDNSKILTLKLARILLENELKAYTKVDLEQARQNGTSQLNGDVTFKRTSNEKPFTRLILERLLLPHIDQVDSIKWLLGLDETGTVVKVSRGPLLDLIEDDSDPGVPTNLTPIAAVIADQTITKGQQWTFQHDIFADDQGCTYSITTPLPPGITYKAATREFTGTVPVAKLDGYLITVRGTDPFGQYAEESFTLFVLESAQSLTMNEPTWNATSRVVTVQASSTDTTTMIEYRGIGLRDWGVDPNLTVPSWLLGNQFILEARQGKLSAQRAWSPPNTAVNRPPIPIATIPAQTGKVGSGYSYSIGNVFNDPDGDSLTLTADQLPAGLTMSNLGVISGTPTQAILNMYVTITATDIAGNKGQTFFYFTVNPETATLAISGASYNPDSGQITIYTTGGDSSQKQFLIPELTEVWQNSNVFTANATLQQNGGQVTLLCRQSGVQVSFTYVVPAAATGGVTAIGVIYTDGTGLMTVAKVTDNRTYEVSVVAEGSAVSGFALMQLGSIFLENNPTNYNRSKPTPWVIPSNGNYTVVVQPVGSPSERRQGTITIDGTAFSIELLQNANTVITPANQSVFNPVQTWVNGADGEKWAQITNSATPSIPSGQQLYVMVDGKPVSGFGADTTFKQNTTPNIFVFIAAGPYPENTPYSNRASATIQIGNPSGTVTDF